MLALSLAMTSSPSAVLDGPPETFAHDPGGLDYDAPRIWWPDCTVGYTLYFSWDDKLSKGFIGHTLDGDVKTAWRIGPMAPYAGPESPLGKPMVYMSVPSKGSINGVRLRTGAGTNAITSVEVWTNIDPWSLPRPGHADGRLLAQQAYGGRKAAYEVLFAPTEVEWVQVVLKDWEQGEADEIAIAEIELLRDGEPIPWNMTPMVLSTLGGENQEGSVWNVVRKNGEIVRQAGEPWEHFSIAPEDSLVASWTPFDSHNTYWVLDMKKGVFLAEARRVRLLASSSGLEVRWGERRAEFVVTWEDADTVGEEETFVLTWKETHESSRTVASGRRSLAIGGR